MIELTIQETGKQYGSKEKYQLINDETKYFPTLEEAQEYLKERYGNCKRERMYKDDKNGKAGHIGYIFCFHNADMSHSPIDKWLQQDWVSFSTCEDLVLS